jgi:hypothetical protein
LTIAKIYYAHLKSFSKSRKAARLQGEKRSWWIFNTIVRDNG